MDSDDEVPVVENKENVKPVADESTPLVNNNKYQSDNDAFQVVFSRNMENPSAYRSLIRWIAREDILKKLTAYVFSESFHHAPGATFAEKVGNHLHFLFRSESIPQASREAYSRINASDVFADSLNFVSEKIWLPVFSGLLIHDGIVYFSQPFDRYGNTFPDILGGVSPNQNAWSSHLGGDRPDTVSFWAPLASPFVLLTGVALYKYYRNTQLFSAFRKKKSAIVLVGESERYHIGESEEEAETFLNINSNTAKELFSTDSLEQSLFSLLWDKNLSEEERSKKFENFSQDTSWLNIFSVLHALSKIAGSLDQRTLQLAGINDIKTLGSIEEFRRDAFEKLEELTHTYGQKAGMKRKPIQNEVYKNENNNDDLDNETSAPVFSPKPWMKYKESEKIKEYFESQYKYLPHYIYGNYLLWTLGKRKSLLANIVFLPVPFFVMYAKVRLVEMLVQKIIQIIDYFTDKKACESQNKQFVYMPEFAEYECTVCGDWPFVYYNNVFDSEGCLQGVLQVRRKPEEISQYLDRIVKHPDFKTVDLTQQNWYAWSEPQWKLFLNKISEVAHELGTFNLSHPLINPIFPTDGKMEDLKTFLSQVNVSRFDIHNQQIGDTLFSELVQGLQNNTITYLDITYNQLTDDAAERLSQFVASSNTLKVLKAANNHFSDAGIKSLAPAVSNSTVTELDLSQNLFAAEGVQALSDAIADPDNKLEILDISGNDLSCADVQNFGEAISQSEMLEHLDLSDTNFDQIQASQFMPQVTQGKIKSLDFSRNPLTDDGVFLIVKNVQNSSITALYFAHSVLTDEGMEALSHIINFTRLEKFSVAQSKTFSVNGVEKLLSQLPETTVVLDISGNNLGDGVADVFVDMCNDPKDCRLQKVYVGGNQLTDEGGSRLVRLFAVQNVTDLSLDHNQLTDKTMQVLAEVFPESNFTNLDLSHNLIANDTGTKNLASSFSKHPKIESLSLANNQLGDEAGIAIAKHLIKPPTPHIDEIGNPTESIDEMRALRKTNACTDIIAVDLRHNQLSETSVTALCRVLPQTKMPVENLHLEENLSPDRDVRNCQIISRNQRQTSPFNFFKTSEVNLPENHFSTTPNFPTSMTTPQVSPGINTMPEVRIVNNLSPQISPGNSTNFNNNNSSSNSSMLLGSLLFPGITSAILALLAIYLLYRALSPVVRSGWSNGTSLFERCKAPTNENESLNNENNDSVDSESKLEDSDDEEPHQNQSIVVYNTATQTL